MNTGFWVPDDMKDREWTAKDYRRIYEQATGYDRRSVDTLLDDLRYEKEKKQMLLARIDAMDGDHTSVKESIRQGIADLREMRDEIQRLHREDQGGAIDALHAAFRQWTAVQIDKHNIKAKQVADQLEAATSGMTERERAWLALRIQQTPHGKDGLCIPIPQRKLADALGIGKETVYRIEKKQEKRKEILALYLSLDIKARVKRGGRVTTGKKTKAR